MIHNPVKLLICAERQSATASNQPQRLALPVVAPNSQPILAICLPTSSFNSVGKGPAPTRVV